MLKVADIGNAVASVAFEYPISSAFLFGSYARGEQTPASDVDLVVNLSKPLGFKRAQLANRLAAELGTDVDVVFGESQLYPPVRENFRREAVAIYEA